MYLGREVEPQVAVVLQAILDQKRDLVREAQFDLAGQTTRFAEVDQVLQREGEGYGLGQVNLDVEVRLLNIRMTPQLDGARTDVTRALEADALLCAFDCDLKPSLAGLHRHIHKHIPDSDKALRSLQIRWNSAAGRVIVAAYSVSGIPRCS
jgi:hypothetical protein